MTFRRPRLTDVFAADLINRWSRFDPRSIRFDDRVESWDQALERSTGYDDQQIIERLLVANRAVRDGQAPAQRDGILLDEVLINWPLLACVLVEMSRAEALRVIDLGGALGGTYHAVRSSLPLQTSLEWLVVEQPAVVEVGNKEFSSSELGFCCLEDLKLSQEKQNLLLVSNTLQYLPEPLSTVRSLVDDGAHSVILEGVPTVDVPLDKVPSLQEVPASIVKSSYPAWLFSSSIFSILAADMFTVVGSWASPGAAGFTRRGKRITWRGAHLRVL